MFFVVEIGSRRVRFAGVTTNPNGEWVTQKARNLAVDGRFEDMRFLIRDRDSKFTRSFDEVLASVRRQGDQDPGPFAEG